MKKVLTQEAVGHVLCHDITQIIKDVKKDVAFKKGHVVKEEDIPVLLSLGKDHLYIWEQKEGMIHENGAAEVLYALCANTNITRSGVKEGKIDAIAEEDGMFFVDVERLNAVNELDEIIIATRSCYYPVKKGEKLAGMRVIPLVIEGEKLEKAKALVGQTPLLKLYPYLPLKAGVITTGNEVFYGRIVDQFTPVIDEKWKNYGGEVVHHITVPDDMDEILKAIAEMRAKNVDVIICTGGMSVDPDDLTPSAITASGAKLVTYGAPVLPGAMFLLAYFDDGTPVMGLPGCVMYSSTTIFDLMLPRVFAGLPITKREISRLGHGGLCVKCEVCHYPNCSFGKGV